jgi:hypothetical protein
MPQGFGSSTRDDATSWNFVKSPLVQQLLAQTATKLDHLPHGPQQPHFRQNRFDPA